MSLTYRFKKEKLENGGYASRPRILVTLTGSSASFEVPALIDTGCDTTVIPESMARALGLNLDGEKEKLFAFRECNEVIQSEVDILFLGKASRQTEALKGVPVLIVKSRDGYEDEEDIVLGINGIFDVFDITFKKSQNKITLKKSKNISLRRADRRS